MSAKSSGFKKNDFMDLEIASAMCSEEDLSGENVPISLSKQTWLTLPLASMLFGSPQFLQSKSVDLVPSMMHKLPKELATLLATF